MVEWDANDFKIQETQMYRKKLIVTFIAVAVCTVAYTQPQQDIEAMRKTAVQKQVVLGHKVKEERREQDVKAGVIQKRNANFSISILEGFKGCVKRTRSAIEDKMRRIDDYLKDFDWHGSFISGLDNEWRMALSDIKEPTTIEEAQEMLNDMFWVEKSVSYVFDWLRTNKAKRDEAKSLGKIVTPVTEDELAKALTTKVTLDLARSYFDVEKWENCIAELEKVLSWDPGNAEARQLKIAAESHLVPTAKAEREVRERERRAKWRKSGEEFAINDPYSLHMTMKEKKVVASTRSERGTHDKVQLWAGGPYWATTNIGAERPEDYGYYFWWGDTVGYKREGNVWVASDGSTSHFSFCVENTPTYNKGVGTLKREGWITTEGVLALEHDAAHVHWGGDWRIPTEQELEDLHKKCDWKWVTVNGVKGYLVSGKGAYASNNIFLPCTGAGAGASMRYLFGDCISTGFYWSSVPDSDYHGRYSWYFSLHSRGLYTNYGHRHYGQPVRPVQGFTK